jgi:hypothetical protein
MSDQKELDIQELINMNYRVLTILGYGMAVMFKMNDVIEDFTGRKYDHQGFEWYKKAIEDVVYRNKPLPPMP